MGKASNASGNAALVLTAQLKLLDRTLLRSGPDFALPGGQDLPLSALTYRMVLPAFRLVTMAIGVLAAVLFIDELGILPQKGWR
jgi:hypothetical protein